LHHCKPRTNPTFNAAPSGGSNPAITRLANAKCAAVTTRTPDPAIAQANLERLQKRYKILEMTAEQWEAEFRKRPEVQKTMAEAAAWRAEKAAKDAAKALREEQKALETRVEQTIDSVLELPDEVLFASNAIQDLASELELEDQHLEQVQTQADQFTTGLARLLGFIVTFGAMCQTKKWTS
jgi:chemotaxis protein histidine kinase CheA